VTQTASLFLPSAANNADCFLLIEWLNVKEQRALRHGVPAKMWQALLRLLSDRQSNALTEAGTGSFSTNVTARRLNGERQEDLQWCFEGYELTEEPRSQFAREFALNSLAN